MAGGARKAAVLLRSLDRTSAAELLKSAAPEMITEIAAELAYLDAAGQSGPVDPAQSAAEFFGLLSKKGGRGSGRKFVEEVLDGALGEQRSQEVLQEAQGLLHARDPFLPIRSAPVADIAQALKGESAQVAAVVLAELSAEGSAELLSLLEDDVRAGAVRGMISGAGVGAQVRQRVADVVQERLNALGRVEQTDTGAGERDKRQQQLRRVAVLLRRLKKELRDAMISSISEQDQETATAVQELMVTWEDLTQVADRALQEALRSADARDLSLALVGADQALVEKVRANMSERAAAALEEETSLLSAPKDEEVQQAQEKVLKTLREMNASGDLSFEEGQAA